METPSRDGTSGSWPPGPIVLGGQPWTDGTVVDADPLARALGVRRGIPLGSAHRLAPEATFLDLAPDADRDALEAACERLAAFSPGIAGDERRPRRRLRPDRRPRRRADPPVGDRGDARRPDRRGARARPARPAPRAGIAGTSFAATVAAAHAPEGGAPILVPPGDDERFLAPYPARLLTRDPEIRARLARFGLRTIGQVADAAAVRAGRPVRRGGGEAPCPGARRGDGSVPAAPRPGAPGPGPPARAPGGGPGAVRFVLHRLAAALADQLQARGQAAGLARLAVTHDLAFARRGTPELLRFEQRFPEPTADAEAIERLLFARLEQQPPPAAVARLELELGLVEAATGQQLPLFVPQAARDARLAWQLARLAIAFGADRVRRVEVTDPEAPLAEARWRWRPVAGAAVVGEDVP